MNDPTNPDNPPQAMLYATINAGITTFGALLEQLSLPSSHEKAGA